MSRRSPRAAPTASVKGGPRPLTGFRLLEALIAAWRPLARLDVDGFAVLRSRGITRRATSVVALDAPSDDAALTAAVERIEMLFDVAGEQAVFRVLESHGPAQLDDLLASRGYDRAGASAVLELPLTGARLPVPHPSAVIRVGPLDEDWFEAAWRLAPREGEQARETLHDIMAGTPAAQVLLTAEGEGTDADAIAVGRAALVEAGREMVAVLNVIAVHPDHRRAGLGRALSQTLLSIAAAQGATRALLEVECDNTAAVALYRGLGFRRSGAYHYRMRTHLSEPT